MSCLSEREVAGRCRFLCVIFLPAKMWVYSEFLSSEGIVSSTKMLKGFATAKAIHLIFAMYIMIKCLPSLPPTVMLV